MTAADHWRTTLREALLQARRDRDAIRVAALRSALSAIDNAETPDGIELIATTGQTIAGGVSGLGAAEVARRELSDDQIRALLHAEVDERLAAAQQCAGHDDRVVTLRGQAAVIADVLGGRPRA